MGTVFGPAKCCSVLVLCHCRSMSTANLHRFTSSDTQGCCQVCFAKNCQPVATVFGPAQCCSALVLCHCRSVSMASLHRFTSSDTQGCWECVLQRSASQWGLFLALHRAAVPWCCVTADLCQWQVFIGLLPVTHKAAESVFCKELPASGDCFWPCTVLQCLGVVSLQICVNSKPS